MVIGDQNGVGHLLSNYIALVIFQGEDDLEALLLTLMSAVACDPHLRLSRYGTLWRRVEILCIQSTVFLGMLDLLGRLEG